MEFQANRPRGTLIRNPVFRMLQKACVSHPFGRPETSTVHREKLFLMWSVVHKRPTNWSEHLIKHLHRIPSGDKRMICCGTVVGFIARHLGVDTSGWTPDDGEMWMDIPFLRRADSFGVDQTGRAYLMQKRRDHHPLPDDINTYINGPTFPDNWGMNRKVHKAAVEQNPAVTPLTSREPRWSYREVLHLEAPEQRMEDEPPQQDEQPQHDADDPGPSKRRDREERYEKDIGLLNSRMERLETSYRDFTDQKEAHWASQE